MRADIAAVSMDINSNTSEFQTLLSRPDRLPFARFCSKSFLAAFIVICGMALLLNPLEPVLSQAAQTTSADLTNLSLEDLMSIEITSVSKKRQKLSDAAAAIFVITQEDIRRSGATCIPELLRMAPGIEVARIDSNKWAVTARGFNGRFANKLLVLVDGRSVYTPLFSGTLWETIDYPLEDIDRIEVIRGPGASIWGANAVNGVINIITKKAKNTQGGLFTTAGGNEEQGAVAARYGGKVGDDLNYRVYGKFDNYGNFGEVSGQDGADAWRTGRGGFRADYNPTKSDSLTFQGDIFENHDGSRYQIPSLDFPYIQTFGCNTEFDGGNVLGRWNHALSPSSNFSLQLYYDRVQINDVNFRIALDTYDLDFQHQFQLGDRQNIVWGLGYRYTQDATNGSFYVSFVPYVNQLNLFSSFFQDEIALLPDRLKLILGARIEHNNFTGVEIQPTARLLWTIDNRNTIWTSVSRAARTPSIGDENIRFTPAVFPVTMAPGQPPILDIVRAFGNTDLSSEQLTAFELGYRCQAIDKLSIDIATFFNIYDQLLANATGPTTLVLGPQPYLLTPINTNNDGKGNTYGAEVSAEWQPFKWWRLMAAYTFLKMDLDSLETTDNGGSPANQFSLRSWVDLPGNLQLDTWLRHVDPILTGNIPGYTTLDVRLAWKVSKNLELSIVGQNLFQKYHAEFLPDTLGTVASEVPRAVYGKAVWRF